MRSRTFAMAALMLTPACGAGPVMGPSDVTSLGILVAQLERRGATASVAEVMPREAFPFSVSAQRLLVNGEDVYVFEYRDAVSLEQDAARIAPSGTPIGTTQITWVAPPRFYRSPRLIVLYAGSREEVVSVLEAVLGPPFAGMR